MSGQFLPISRDDMEYRGWHQLDVIIVTGDAYVDHPAYGAAVVGRALEDAGFKVGIIAQPNWKNSNALSVLGKPRLFFGVTSGNLDSMVAHYTANKHHRKSDDYSPGGKMGLRPDRASIVYTNKIKEIFPGVPVVLGGIEASLRRLAHFDYWTDTVRRSLLQDAKADILVYGMGEGQTVEVARRLDKGVAVKDISDVPGTVVMKKSTDGIKDFVQVPSFEDVKASTEKFNEAFKTVFQESDPVRGRAIVQKSADWFIVQLPPAKPLKTEEIDRIYALPYQRAWHPVYDKTGGVPGFQTVATSVISHRGCSGGCNFCSLFLHQGRIIQSRSPESIIKEIDDMSKTKGFSGTITDIGGPTANMYKAYCKLWKEKGACRDRMCMSPAKCGNLKLGYNDSIKLWDKAKQLKNVRHVFVGSGLRYDLLCDPYSDAYLESLCRSHVSGQLKVAPEHVCANVLKLMNKPAIRVYEQFLDRFMSVSKAVGKRQFVVNYFLSAHPGATLNDALDLALYLAKNKIRPEQVQDYIPLPMTASSCMYYTGRDPFSGRSVYVAKNLRERKLQRALIQYWQPQNAKYVIEALKKLGRMDIVDTLLGRRFYRKAAA